jgi:membrane-bound lytic murein transglycosylase B
MPRSSSSASRHLGGALLLGVACVVTLGDAVRPTPALAQSEQPGQGDFQRFIEGLWPEARARGVSRPTFENAFRDVGPDAKIIALTKKQSEFVRPIWEYVDGAVSAQRLDRGRQIAAQ